MLHTNTNILITIKQRYVKDNITIVIFIQSYLWFHILNYNKNFSTETLYQQTSNSMELKAPSLNSVSILDISISCK